MGIEKALVGSLDIIQSRIIYNESLSSRLLSFDFLLLREFMYRYDPNSRENLLNAESRFKYNEQELKNFLENMRQVILYAINEDLKFLKEIYQLINDVSSKEAGLLKLMHRLDIKINTEEFNYRFLKIKNEDIHKKILKKNKSKNTNKKPKSTINVSGSASSPLYFNIEQDYMNLDERCELFALQAVWDLLYDAAGDYERKFFDEYIETKVGYAVGGSEYSQVPKKEMKDILKNQLELKAEIKEFENELYEKIGQLHESLKEKTSKKIDDNTKFISVLKNKANRIQSSKIYVPHGISEVDLLFEEYNDYYYYNNEQMLEYYNKLKEVKKNIFALEDKKESNVDIKKIDDEVKLNPVEYAVYTSTIVSKAEIESSLNDTLSVENNNNIEQEVIQPFLKSAGNEENPNKEIIESVLDVAMTADYNDVALKEELQQIEHDLNALISSKENEKREREILKTKRRDEIKNDVLFLKEQSKKYCVSDELVEKNIQSISFLFSANKNVRFDQVETLIRKLGGDIIQGKNGSHCTVVFSNKMTALGVHRDDFIEQKSGICKPHGRGKGENKLGYFTLDLVKDAISKVLSAEALKKINDYIEGDYIKKENDNLNVGPSSSSISTDQPMNTNSSMLFSAISSPSLSGQENSTNQKNKRQTTKGKFVAADGLYNNYLSKSITEINNNLKNSAMRVGKPIINMGPNMRNLTDGIQQLRNSNLSLAIVVECVNTIKRNLKPS